MMTENNNLAQVQKDLRALLLGGLDTIKPAPVAPVKKKKKPRKPNKKEQALVNAPLQEGQEVFVYFNLHLFMWSVKDVSSGLVVCYTHDIELSNCTFKVSEKRRQRVLIEQKKNVHAGVQGFVSKSCYTLNQTATYNPYLYTSFVDVKTEAPLYSADLVAMSHGKVFYK